MDRSKGESSWGFGRVGWSGGPWAVAEHDPTGAFPRRGGHAALRSVALGVHWAAKVAGVSIPSAECGRRWL